MSQSAAALVIAVLLSFGYVGLATVAFRHLLPQHRSDEMQRLLALTLWWPFYDIYDAGAKRVRRVGMVILVLGVVAYLTWGLSA